MRQLCLAVASLVACAEVDSPNPQEVLPDNYRTAFVEARTCRTSSGHDLNNIVVRVDPKLRNVYEAGPYPFPVGSLVVEEEYHDTACTDLLGYSVMRKEVAKPDSPTGDWTFLHLDGRRRVIETNTPRCVSCHARFECSVRDRVCADP
jgi:hypothetical protein